MLGRAMPMRTQEEADKWELKLAYVAGMIDGYERFADKADDARVCEVWQALSYVVASRTELVPYFRLRQVIEQTPNALTSYGTDFYKHDLHHMRKYPADKPFLWALRPGGTHMHYFHDETWEQANRWVEGIRQTWGSEVLRFGLYDGRTNHFYDFQLPVNADEVNVQRMVDELPRMRRAAALAV